jgi:hypothetical protein
MGQQTKCNGCKGNAVKVKNGGTWHCENTPKLPLSGKEDSALVTLKGRECKYYYLEGPTP